MVGKAYGPDFRLGGWVFRMTRKSGKPDLIAAILAAGLILGAMPAMAQFADVTGTIVDQKGFKLRNVIIAADAAYDTTDIAGKFGLGRGPVVGLRPARSRAVAAPGMTLAGSSLRFGGLPKGSILKAELMLASGRRAGSSAALNAAGGRADLDLNALASGLPREGLYVLRIDAGNGVEHHLLARLGGGSWALSSTGASTPAGLTAPRGRTELRKSAVAPAMLTISKPGYVSQTVSVPSSGDVGMVTLKLDPTAAVVEAPFELSPLYYPTGWAGDHTSISATVDTVDIRAGDSDGKSTRWSYQPDTSKPGMRWAAVLYQYPENNWGALPGRRIIGATRITFWAKGAVGGEAVDFKTGNDTYLTPPDSGMYKDTYGSAIRETLTREWKLYEIPLAESSTEMVISGFIWAARMPVGGTPVTFHIDEIRFE